jgi:hypothetical protein
MNFCKTVRKNTVQDLPADGRGGVVSLTSNVAAVSPEHGGGVRL